MKISNMICPFCKNEQFIRVENSNPNNAFMLNEVNVKTSTIYPDSGIAVDVEQCSKCGTMFLHSHID